MCACACVCACVRERHCSGYLSLDFKKLNNQNKFLNYTQTATEAPQECVLRREKKDSNVQIIMLVKFYSKMQANKAIHVFLSCPGKKNH